MPTITKVPSWMLGIDKGREQMEPTLDKEADGGQAHSGLLQPEMPL